MKAGRPVAAVVPVDPDALEDWILANAPEFVNAMREGEEEWRQGKTVSLDDYLASLKKEPPKKRASARGRRAGR
ncbi:MAG: hypothetical protein ACRDF0_03450 [Candidatus Limnocylindria bacterium]